MNLTELREKSPIEIIRSRMERCNERARAFKALPPILHDGDFEKFERLKTERLVEEIAIMAEVLDVMKEADEILSRK
jgi:hypothetical protein